MAASRGSLATAARILRAMSASPVRLASAASAALVLLAGSVPAHALPEDLGPLVPTQWNAGMVPAGGTDVPVLVYYPTGAPGPFPVVEVVHGFARDGSFHTVLADTLASRGLVVVVPDMPCGVAGCDYEVEATAVSDLLDWIAAQGADAASPVYGIVDGGRRAVVGHSAGGRAVFLAAARDTSIDVVVGFDPVDASGPVAAEIAALSVPSVHLMAALPGTCNLDLAWSADVFPTTPPPALLLTVAGAGHCEPEDPTDSVCELFCGAGDRAAAPIFRRYAVAWATCLLGVDPTMGAWVNGAMLDADVTAGLITGAMPVGTAALNCDGPPPGGSDAGTPGTDAAPSADAGTGADAATPDASTDAGGGGNGGGCRCAVVGARGGDATPPQVLALLSLSLLGARTGRVSSRRRKAIDVDE